MILKIAKLISRYCSTLKEYNFHLLRYHSCLVVDKSTSNYDYEVKVIPALNDNYMYVLTDKLKNIAIAVDPVEPDKILNCIKSENAVLKAVLTTHHHIDHAGGNQIISEKVKNLPIYGGDTRIESLTVKLSHNETFQIGDFMIRCLETPCHTSGHVCYFVKFPSSEHICFTGDTLFVGGCGRFFEGTAGQMLKSLGILSALPPNTKIYCGHEYTVNNLKFALCVEPDNLDTAEKLEESKEKLKWNQPTVPSTIGSELLYNPFLRVDKKSVQQFTNANDPVAVMGVLRKLKDTFRG